MGERVLWAFRHDLPGESDEQLTDRARDGDQSAFGELYRRHRKAAEATAWCLLRSKSDADDVVSDAFAGVLSALRNGRGPRDNFRGYLLACVRNGCRSRRAPTVLVEESQLERWNPVLEDPERYVEADTVARAFSSLAPRWQHTLWMTEVEQLAPTEVSERLELSPNAAAALTHRARQAFAEAYLAEHVVAATGKDCRKIAALLPGYVRNQLRDLQQASVERHVMNCQYCAAAVDHLRDVNGSLRSLLPLTPTALGAAAVATEAAVVTGTVTTTVGGLSIGLPSTGMILKGLVAVLLVAPVLSTDSPFSGRGGDDQRAVSVAESEAAAADDDTSAGTTSPTPVATVDSAPSTAAATVPDEDDGETDSGERPVTTTSPTVPSPPTTVPVTLPVTWPVTLPVTLPSVTTPIGVVTALPVDEILDDTVRPVVGSVTEPVVQTLDEALAVMGLGSTGETVVVLRSLVPLLGGPLLAPLVEELLDLASTDSADATDSTGVDPSEDDGDSSGAPVTVPEGSGSSGEPDVGLPVPTSPAGTPQIGVPTVTVPTVTVPVISLPPITVPILDLPPITLPVLSLPPVTVPSITIPELVG